MSKQGIKIILYAAITFIAVALFQNLFAQSDNNAVKQAIKEGAYLVDVRTPQEFAEGSAKGAVNIPLNEVGQRISEFKDKKNIVVFCRSGSRSGQAKNILEKNNFQNVINGGTWQNVDELVKQNKN